MVSVDNDTRICYDNNTKSAERRDFMSPELLTAVLWIPFGIVAFIAGLIYCISGYRKGLWRALGSLAAVVLSTVVSVLVSRLLAGLAAPSLAALIPTGDAGQVSAAALQMVLVSLVSVALAMLLFGVLMLIVTPIIGGIIGKLLGKRLTEVSRGLKWLGMATGLVSALVFALFWLSPIYGTLATAVPVAQSVLSMQEAGEQEAKQVEAYIDSITDHLLVQISGTGPVSTVYDGISRVPVGGASVSVVDMSKAMNEAMELLEQFSGDELKEAIKGKIQEKDADLVGQMVSEGTTPRRLTDLIGSLCDLTSGSGDKGTPIVYIQGYFDNYTTE